MGATFAEFLKIFSASEIQKKFDDNSNSDKPTPFSEKAIARGLPFKTGGKKDALRYASSLKEMQAPSSAPMETRADPVI